MNPDLEVYVARASDPRLISGIYNYCHRRCERCSFTERCLTFIDRREYEAQHPGQDVFQQVHDSFQKTFELLEAWCKREGIDFAMLRADANSPKALAEIRQANDAIDADPLQKLAMTYTHAALKLADSLGKAAPFHGWSPDVREAVDTVAWHAGMVGAKVHRALHGFRESDECDEQDPIQNDWNGSAKVARLAIAQSRDAWRKLCDAGDAAPASPIRQMIALLNHIEAAVVQRFPRAMEFVRPGFDEPEVVAGALSHLAPFEPRPARRTDPGAL